MIQYEKVVRFLIKREKESLPKLTKLVEHGELSMIQALFIMDSTGNLPEEFDKLKASNYKSEAWLVYAGYETELRLVLLEVNPDKMSLRISVMHSGEDDSLKTIHLLDCFIQTIVDHCPDLAKLIDAFDVIGARCRFIEANAEDMQEMTAAAEKDGKGIVPDKGNTVSMEFETVAMFPRKEG